MFGLEDELYDKWRKAEDTINTIRLVIQDLKEEADANVLAGSCREDKQYAYGIRRAINSLEHLL